MKKLRSYTSIWNVEKVIYAIQDFELLVPVTITQIKLFVLFFMVVLIFGKLPPLIFIGNKLIRYLVLPGLLTYLFSQKAFDGKKPFGFLKSAVTYYVRPKITYAGKPVRVSRPFDFKESVTAVRSERYAPYQISD